MSTELRLFCKLLDTGRSIGYATATITLPGTWSGQTAWSLDGSMSRKRTPDWLEHRLTMTPRGLLLWEEPADVRQLAAGALGDWKFVPSDKIGEACLHAATGTGTDGDWLPIAPVSVDAIIAAASPGEDSQGNAVAAT